MFKRIKVITLLVSVLLVLGIMQLISAGIFINALNNDKDNFTVSQVASQNVAEFTDAWISLNQARVTLNRGMLRLQSSVATQINGGQLNELVETAKICWLMHRRISINTTHCQIGLGEELPGS
jgi:methyl-accepting chemotaxis protein-1 (serine sensor receptor)